MFALLLQSETIKTDYTRFNGELHTEIATHYGNRIALLGPCLSHFARIEKEFAQHVNNSLKDVHTVELSAHNEAKRNAELAMNTQRLATGSTSAIAPISHVASNTFTSVPSQQTEGVPVTANAAPVASAPQAEANPFEVQTQPTTV